LQSVQSAILLLVGEHELPAFKRCAELIRRAVRSARRVYLPEVGHLCMLERPQECASLIAEHLRTADPRTTLREAHYARMS
jgi:pimeloyl-ACP methyl ester carboxylesterase